MCLNPGVILRLKPLLIYDGDCKFCCQWIARWQKITGDRVDYSPFQEIGGQFPEISEARFNRSIQLVEPGKISEGALGVFRVLAYNPQARLPLWVYENFPGVAPVSEWVYRWMTARRQGFWTITRLLWGEWSKPPAYSLTRGCFLRFLGIIYCVAFSSLMVQITGLVGSGGILPAADFFGAIDQRFGLEKYWFFPSLFWLNDGDWVLQGMCIAGALAGLGLTVGVLRPSILFLAWLLYLSLFTVGRVFLGYQWDTLLLETGFLAIFLSPWYQRRDGTFEPPSLIVLWLGRLLLFKLMFSSGLGKLAGDDPTWQNLTALIYHYETQPLPTWIGWYAHQLPVWFQKFSVVGMFLVELIVPFFIFAPRRLRFFAGAFMASFQVIIILTGNYTFFNLLTIALCVLLLDDALLSRYAFAGVSYRRRKILFRSREPIFRRLSIFFFTGIILLLSWFQVSGLLANRIKVPGSVTILVNLLRPFHLVNGYGLFTVMTTRRSEIIVEGSNDLNAWIEYEFKWKPGDLARAPAFIAPHQPRLDWQLWFSAFSSYERDPWVVNFLVRLLEGSPEVTALLANNPFPETPPRYIRALLYDYRFSKQASKATDGRWWRRQFVRPYLPILNLPPSS